MIKPIWLPYFPEGYEPREIQVKAIDFAIQTFKDKKFCIIEAPVGTGKSFIALTLANYLNQQQRNNQSLILTTQIILQNQYQKQFSQITNISARGNYKCPIFGDSTCADMRWLHIYGGVPKCPSCIYDQVKQKFLQQSMAVTNTAFFFSNLEYNEQLIPHKKFIAVDEAHNLEQEIIKYKALQLEFNTLRKQYGFSKDDWIKRGTHPFKWLKETFLTWAKRKEAQLSKTIQGSNKGITFSRSKILQISKNFDFLNKLICQFNRTLAVYDADRWITEYDDKAFKMTPLFAYDFSKQSLFDVGDKILLMSGTILDKQSYCRNLGIDVNQCGFLSLDSPFPIQNRKIFIILSGNMSRKYIEKTMPKLVDDIEKILYLHEGQKGIIHVSSHKMARDIYKGVGSDRLIIVDDFYNRDQMLEHHYQSESDTVLISPSMMEGLDLKDQLSRFQIIAKVPFPNLGSRYISMKKDLIQKWYQYQTAKLMVQSYGRSIRSKDDYAVTYILDQSFLWFYKMNKRLFPEYFTAAISYGKL